jgi:hypothetical protein
MVNWYLRAVVAALVVFVLAPVGLYGDYYDSFADGQYSRDTWQIDAPQWWFYPLFGVNQFADANYHALRLYADANPYLPYYAMAAIAADDLDYDPNTSATWWDDTTRSSAAIAAMA